MRGFKSDDQEPEPTDDLVDVVCMAETDKALLVRMVESNEEHWVPKSALHSSSEVTARGEGGLLVVFKWWHEKHWNGTTPEKTKAKPQGKAIGVSDLGGVQKLLVGKGITVVRFEGDRVVLDAKRLGAFSGKDLTEAVRALDVARRE
jgi:hypothetical protein